MTAIEPERLGRQPRDPREEQLLLERVQRLEALGPNICAHATKWLTSAGRTPPQLTSADVARVVDEVWQQDVMLRAAGLDGRGSLATKLADIEATAENPKAFAGRTVLLLGPVLAHKTRDLFRSAGFQVESSDVEGFQVSSSDSTDEAALDKLVAQEILRAIAEELSPIARELWELEYNHGVTGRIEQQAVTGHGERAIRKARKELDAFRLMLVERYAAFIGVLGSLPVIRRVVSPQPAEAAGGGILALLGGGTAAKLAAGGLTAVLATGAAIEVPRVVREQRKPVEKIQPVARQAAQPTVERAVRRTRFTVAKAERQEQQRRAVVRRAAARKKAAAAAAAKKKAAAEQQREQTVRQLAPDTTAAPAPAPSAPAGAPSSSSGDIRPMDSGPSPVGQEFR